MNTPTQVGRYKILEEIGRGGMGCVYRAHDPSLDRQVAVKVIAPHVEGELDTANLKARFLREARLAARLDHPGIVRVFDAGADAGVLWLVMELVEGESLSQRLGSGEIPSRAEALELLVQVAEALAAAHAAGVIHRDIKPANILLLPNGKPKVTDFGVARAIGDQTALTRTGTTVGSPAYMAPEQVRGEPADARADLFSLGVVAYQLLLQRRPFPADTITTLVYQILNHDPLADEMILGALGDDATAFLSHALAKDREERFSDATQFAAAARALAGVAPIPPPTLETDPTIIQRTEPPPLAQRSQANLWLGLTVGVLGAALIAVLATLMYRFVLFPSQSGSIDVIQAHEASTTSPPEPGTARSLPPQTMPPVESQTPVDGDESQTAAVSAPEPVAPTAVATPKADRGNTEPRNSSPPAAQWTPKKPPTPTAPPWRPTQTPAPAPTAVPTLLPTPLPTTPPTPTPTPPPIEEMFACSRGAEFHVDPEETMVTINGEDIGIADDWDGRGGGKVYFFPGPGRYLVKLSCAGRRTTWIRIAVTEYADDEIVDIDTELEKQR
ncbi:MAG: protein kinase [Thermoanaerobaculales bacterium]|nr:protein kinase [Thermoanaerobaculales bacterium]